MKKAYRVKYQKTNENVKLYMWILATKKSIALQEAKEKLGETVIIISIKKENF